MVESLIRVIFVVRLDRASRGDITSEARNWRRFNPAPLFREFSLDNVLTSGTRSSMHERHHWSRGDSVRLPGVFAAVWLLSSRGFGAQFSSPIEGGRNGLGRRIRSVDGIASLGESFAFYAALPAVLTE